MACVEYSPMSRCSRSPGMSLSLPDQQPAHILEVFSRSQIQWLQHSSPVRIFFLRVEGIHSCPKFQLGIAISPSSSAIHLAPALRIAFRLALESSMISETDPGVLDCLTLAFHNIVATRRLSGNGRGQQLTLCCTMIAQFISDQT
jgi:hypothetical protein